MSMTGLPEMINRLLGYMKPGLAFFRDNILDQLILPQVPEGN
jgi:hypothetical protein